MVVNLIESLQVLDGGHGMGQSFIVGSLASSGRSYEHETVTHLDSVVELDDFGEEGFMGLIVESHATLLHLDHQGAIVDIGLIHSREQILDDVLKERQVILEELRHINISEGSEEKLVLSHIRVLSLEQPSSIDHRLHSSHSVIVVILGRQLLRVKLEGGDHLLSQDSGTGVP
jgi:hypothetical protein